MQVYDRRTKRNYKTQGLLIVDEDTREDCYKYYRYSKPFFDATLLWMLSDIGDGVLARQLRAGAGFVRFFAEDLSPADRLDALPRVLALAAT